MTKWTPKWTPEDCVEVVSARENARAFRGRFSQVEVRGLEPLASSMTWKNATRRRFAPGLFRLKPLRLPDVARYKAPSIEIGTVRGSTWGSTCNPRSLDHVNME